MFNPLGYERYEEAKIEEKKNGLIKNSPYRSWVITGIFALAVLEIYVLGIAL